VEIWMQEMIVATKYNLKGKGLFHESQDEHSNRIYEDLNLLEKYYVAMIENLKKLFSYIFN
jgi:hypothetical protein